MTPTDVDWRNVGLWGPRGTPVKRRRPWGPIDVVWGIVWLLGANVVLAVPVVIWMLTSDATTLSPDIATSSLVITAGLLTLWAVFAGFPLLVTRRHGSRSLAIDFGWRLPDRPDWLLGVKLGLVLRVADLSVGWLATKIGWTTGDNSSWLFEPRAWVITGFFVLGAAVIAPALEELFFRGLIMRALARAKRFTGRASTVFAVTVSSLIFGALHTTALDASGLYVMLATASAGAVLAVLATRRGNLGASIAAHVVFNTTGVIFAMVVSR